MRSAAFWMMVTAMLILAFIWQEHKIYMPQPEPWPTVSGTIVSNTINTVETESGSQFKVDVVYRYKNGDKEVQGTRIEPARTSYPSLKQAQRVAKAFPVGKETKVYVNPVDKSDPPSVLIWQFPKVVSPVVFIIIVLVATSAVLYMLSEYKKYQK